MSRRPRLAAAFGAAALLVVTLVLARHAIASVLLERLLSTATGYSVGFGGMTLGWSHAVFDDVHVRRNGEPVFAAHRVEVDYALRDVFPGGRHRYGFAGITVDRPTITLIRHRDGTYNLNGFGTSPPLSAPTGTAATPLRFTVRVRDGTIRLIDDAPLEPDLAEQQIVGVSATASVASNARSVARIDGTLLERRSQTAPLERWPLHERSVIDEKQGFAIHRLRAAALPLRGLLDFLIHAPVARFDDGVLRRLDVFAYALDARSGTPSAYRLGGGGDLRGAVVHLGPLAKPVRGLRGHVDLFDDGITTRRLEGRVAGIPLVVRGGLYNFAALRFRLGVAADADLQALRTLFPFLAPQPIAGRVRLQTLVTGSVEDPLIRTAIAAPRVAYGSIPLHALDGIVDYLDDRVSFSGVHVAFAALHADANGEVDLAGNNPSIEGFVDARGPAAAVPYAQQVASGETLEGAAVVTGTGKSGFAVSGVLAAAGAGGSGQGFVTVDRRGVGEFGPFLFHRPDGSSLAGGLRLERPISAIAGWLDARRYRISAPTTAVLLPGVVLPSFPMIGGVVDAALVAGGTPSDFSLAGRVRASDARYQQFRLGSVTAGLAGTLDALRLQHVALDGPIGRFTGEGALAGGTFGVRGDYVGSLQALIPFTGPIGARGAVRAPVAALVDAAGIAVQTTGAALRRGRVRGIALERAAGTFTVTDGGVRIVAVDARVGGATAVAAQRGPDVAVSAVGVPASAFRDTGLPLEAGRLSLFGVGDLHVPSFRGSLDLDDGRVLGYPVSGWADLNFTGSTLGVAEGIAAVGSTYGRIGGRIEGIGGPGFGYDVDADIPLGDVATLAQTLHVPVGDLRGTFDATVAIRGAGGHPAIQGTVHVPEGSFNGLAFSAAAGRFTLAPPAFHVSDGRVTVGSTRASFAGALTPSGLDLKIASPHADLADFDGYFDQGDVLAGTGSLAFDFADDAQTIRTSGAVALRGARVRRFPLGTVAGRWSTVGQTIRTAFSLSGTSGSVQADGTIDPARGAPLAALTGARYDLTLHARDIDLGRYVPAIGVTSPAILGRLQFDGRVAGRFPRLAVGGQASVSGGQIGRFPVRSAEARTQIVGDRIALQDASADLGFVRLSGSGSFGLNAADPLALRFHAAIPDLGVAARRLRPRSPLDVGGTLDVDTLVRGTLAAPQVTAGFDLEQGRYDGFAVPRVVGSVESNLRTLQLDNIELSMGKGTAVIAGSLPIRLQPLGIGPGSTPLSLTLDAQGVDLAPFSPLVPGGTKLAGTLDGRLAVEGTVAAPRIFGDATLTGGSYVSHFESTPIRNLAASVHFGGTSVALQALHARLGSGTLEAHGDLSVPRLDAARRTYVLDVAARGAQFDFPQYASGQLDGTAQLLSEPARPQLDGSLTLSNTTVPFAAVLRAAQGMGPNPAVPLPFDLGFDLGLDVGDNVRVKSPIVNVGATGRLALTGSLSDPRLGGVLNATRGGVFSTYQTLFRIQRARVAFDPSRGVVPDLDVRATAHVTNPDPNTIRNAIGSADITVSLQGPANDYRIGYSSEPPYSQAQILALLTDLPLLGAVNFDQSGASVLLRGAPPAFNVLLPPGVTPYQTGAYSFQQAAFSLLSTQLTQRFISPVETALGSTLGLTDLNVTLDYGGRVGYDTLKEISRRRQVYVRFGQVLSYPVETHLGFEAQPNAATTATFSYFTQNGSPSYQNSIFGTSSTVMIQNGVQPLTNRNGFTFTVVRKYP